MNKSERQNQIIAVFGRKGSGKTTLIRKIIVPARRLLVYDKLNEFDAGQVFYDPQALYDYVIKAPKFQAVYRPVDTAFGVDWLARLALALGDCVITIDEVDLYASTYYMSEALYNIIHIGRHFNTSIVMASRMPQRIRNDITAQADVIITFEQQGRPLDYILEFADEPGAEGKIKALKKYQYYVVSGKFSLDTLRNA